MNPYLAARHQPSTPSIYHDKEFRHNHQEINDAIHRNDKEYIRSHVRKPAMGGPVNLSEDPLLNVLIAYRKSNLAIQLLEEISEDDLMLSNFDGDTVLHAAVMERDVKVATALIERKKDLLHARNKQLESPLHKAALYGERELFWLLEENGGDCNARRENGDTVLHCAIMGNAPRLALEIATKYPLLTRTRNSRALTPMQLVVTIPDAFRSKLSLGPLEALIYECIPLEDSISANEIHKGDIEKQVTQENYEHLYSFIMRYRQRFRPNYATFFAMLSIACIPARWIWFLTFRILKQMFARVEFLHQLKTNHKQAMKLVEYLARDPEYWDFFVMGRTGTMPPPPKPDEVQHTREMMNASTGDTRAQSEARAVESKRWDESPLTLGAKMGLHEFVERILKVCPQSAVYLDSEGKNILQVAIQNGQEKIVGIVELMATGPNAVLPSWLLSSIDINTKNTILHFAAETRRKENAVPLQMQTELQWFERVRKLVPKELEYRRNDMEKTAQELFTENHKEMVKDAKIQLVKIGETGSGLATGVIFALSSFSFPDDKEEKAVFKAFSHAYVISLTSAATALILFMALTASTYNEQDFRKSLPAKYFFANASYYASLAALLVAFSCNIYIKIYGGGNQEAKHIVPLVSELAIFPVVCFFLLLYSYAWLYKARK